MNLNRRSFLGLSGLAGAAAIIPGMGLLTSCNPVDSPHLKELPDLTTATSDQSFWQMVNEYFLPHPDLINLNSGATSPSPMHVMRIFQEAWQVHNQLPGMSLVTDAHETIETARNHLSDFISCDPKSLALVRNATEALENVIFGIPMKAGDEVIVTNFDYPHVLNAWRMRERLEGIVIKEIKLDLPTSQGSVLSQFVAAMGPKTRMITVTEVISWTGQILPAREIWEEARLRGIKVLVDGAHSFSNLPSHANGLPGDYFTASLHKWMGLPAGAGILVMDQEAIEELEPRFAPYRWMKASDSRKFEVMGTIPLAQLNAVPVAIKFNESIGRVRKWNRIQSLKTMLYSLIKDVKGIEIHSPTSPEEGAGMLTFGLQDFQPQKLSEMLLTKGFFTAAILHRKVPGIRLSPNIFNTEEEIENFGKALHQISL